MDILQAIILGIVQGLTEFLPISSSAHLVLVPWLLQWNLDPNGIFAFDVLVQMGTTLAVIIYFWRDLWEIVQHVLRGLLQRKPFATPQAKLGWLIVLATIPAVILGVLIKDPLEAVFNSPIQTARLLSGTAIILFLAEYIQKRAGGAKRDLLSINWLDALWIGLWQALSLLPGISRSGSTIAGGVTRGIDRRSAARFSFLMSVPVMLGAGLIGIKDLVETPNFGQFVIPIVVGTVVAAAVGYASIHWLLGYLQKHSLNRFAWYCLGFSMFCLAIGWWRG